MSKRCASCGHANEDSRIFCSACGDPLDAELRLIQDLEKRKHQVTEQAERPRNKADDEEEYVAPARQKGEEKKSALPIILVALVAVVAVAWFFLK